MILVENDAAVLCSASLSKKKKKKKLFFCSSSSSRRKKRPWVVKGREKGNRVCDFVTNDLSKDVEERRDEAARVPSGRHLRVPITSNANLQQKGGLTGGGEGGRG